jgi:branched-chain amino acid transport system ATP-binding protein
LARDLLTLSRVSAGYGELQVLKDVAIRVKRGEIVALIGPNGAGKSTVLKTVFGITRRSAGRILLDGEDITRKKTHELYALGVGYIPQGRINFGELTVHENLLLGTEDADRIEAMYHKFPTLARLRGAYAYSLSGGQQQQLAIARALLQSPKLLLMDEPSLGLSPKLQQEVFAMIAQLRKDGIGVLLVEQNAKKAIEIADTTYLLEQGRVVLSGGRSIIKHKKIREVYLGGG